MLARDTYSRSIKNKKYYIYKNRPPTYEKITQKYKKSLIWYQWTDHAGVNRSCEHRISFLLEFIFNIYIYELQKLHFTLIAYSYFLLLSITIVYYDSTTCYTNTLMILFLIYPPVYYKYWIVYLCSPSHNVVVLILILILILW